MTVADESSSKYHIVNVRGITVAELTEPGRLHLKTLLPKPQPMIKVVF